MSLNKQIQNLIRNRPKYNISDEYYANQGLATNNAFGRDRSVMAQEANIGQSAADSMYEAGNLSGSASALLGVLANVNNSKNSALRGLAADESAIQQQKLAKVLESNTALAEEKDKAWNYNVNEPYQNQMNYLVQKKRARTETAWKMMDFVASLGQSAAKAAKAMAPVPA